MGSVIVAPGHLAACPAFVILPRSAVSHRAVPNGLRRRCARSRNAIIRSLRARTLPPTSPAKVHLPQSLCSDSHGLCLPLCGCRSCRLPLTPSTNALNCACFTNPQSRHSQAPHFATRTRPESAAGLGVPSSTLESKIKARESRHFCPFCVAAALSEALALFLTQKETLDLRGVRAE
jgi:hypothetical protein